MYYHNPSFFQQLELRIRALEEENEQLKKQMEQIKPIHIDNINYKIQELAVKELKGTLNIGMSSLSDPEQVKQWLAEAEGGTEVQLEDMEQGAQDASVFPHTFPQAAFRDETSED